MYDGKTDVVELTDSNFEKLVLNSDDIWLVEFYAPWCGHCKNIVPHWNTAATELKGKVKVGAMDATVHQAISNRFGIRGFPTIKYFPSGPKTVNDAVDYDGGRTGSDIVSWAMVKVAENIPPPEMKEAINSKVFTDACDQKQLCIISVLPHILDCQSKCRKEYIRILKDLGEKYRKNLWGWVWIEAGKQSELEDAFGIGGFGYPAMAAVNSRKMKFAILKGPFSYDGINEFLRDLSYGKGQTAPVKGATLPELATTEPWDGKDGQMPIEEDIDLDDDEDEEPTTTTPPPPPKKAKKDSKKSEL